MSNSLVDRNAFASLITSDMQALEIGPFTSPLLNGDNVSYCDVLSYDELRDRARSIGLDTGNIPPIHFKLGRDYLDEIYEHFDAILSSHAIEHQPDLILHLQQVEKRLSGLGRYFVLIPDKRYCFDNQIAPSTIADVILAYEEKRTSHNIKSVIEHKALTVHNDPRVHWAERTGLQPRPADYHVVRTAIDEFKQLNSAYIDVHAWYFTPDSFAFIIESLNKLELISLQMERLYRTRYGSIEFWAVLSKGECESHPHDLATSSPERDLLAVERDALAAERHALAAERHALVNTVSWRITKPLRCMKSLFVSPGARR